MTISRTRWLVRFRHDCLDRIQKLREELEAGDAGVEPHARHRMLHAMAGEANMLGLPSLAESIRELNDQLRRSPNSLSEARAALDAIEGWVVAGEVADEPPAARRAPPSRTPLPDDEQPRERASVLVVDDSPIVRMMIGAQLEHAEFSVRTVGSAEQALVEIRSHCPAVLISDVHMPGMSGLELLQRVHELAPQLPVVLLSGDPAPPARGEELGAAAWLLKDDDTARLTTTVRSLVGESTQLRE